MSTIGASISVIYVVHSAVCTEGHPESGLLFAEMLNATLFMKGLSTLLQTTFGIRYEVHFFSYSPRTNFAVVRCDNINRSI